MKKLLVITLCLSSLFSCSTHKKKSQCELSSYAVALLDSTLKYYSTARIGLFHENYPSKDDDMVTYLAGEDTIRKNRVAYLWPTSGMFSAVNALLRASDDNRFKQMLDSMIIPGLECYWDSLRLPVCYQSYIAEAGYSDRFYDDNLWIGIDFLESYKLTQKSNYLSSAEKIWKFIESGRDSVLNDGIYWCEQKKLSKNTCSNAPAAVFALKLYEATNEKKYLEAGKELYHWTKSCLQDSADYLYFDNISLDGKINETKFQYNSGQMLQAASLLYKQTGEKEYLTDAHNLAKACNDYFFEDFQTEENHNFRALKNGNIWFVAIMLRRFEELYQIDKNPVYLNNFKETLVYMWKHNPNTNGLFGNDVFVHDIDKQKESKWLLTQAALIEMYARLSVFE